MFLRLLQPKKAVYCFKNCKNYCDDSFSKKRWTEGFSYVSKLVYNYVIYVPRKLNKFLQLNLSLLLFPRYFKGE